MIKLNEILNKIARPFMREAFYVITYEVNSISNNSIGYIQISHIYLFSINGFSIIEHIEGLIKDENKHLENYSVKITGIFRLK